MFRFKFPYRGRQNIGRRAQGGTGVGTTPIAGSATVSLLTVVETTLIPFIVRSKSLMDDFYRYLARPMN